MKEKRMMIKVLDKNLTGGVVDINKIVVGETTRLTAKQAGIENNESDSYYDDNDLGEDTLDISFLDDDN